MWGMPRWLIQAMPKWREHTACFESKPAVSSYQTCCWQIPPPSCLCACVRCLWFLGDENGERFSFHCLRSARFPQHSLCSETDGNVLLHQVCHFTVIFQISQKETKVKENDSSSKHCRDMFCHFAQAMTSFFFGLLYGKTWIVCFVHTHTRTHTQTKPKKQNPNKLIHKRHVITIPETKLVTSGLWRQV